MVPLPGEEAWTKLLNIVARWINEIRNAMMPLTLVIEDWSQYNMHSSAFFSPMFQATSSSMYPQEEKHSEGRFQD